MKVLYKVLMVVLIIMVCSVNNVYAEDEITDGRGENSNSKSGGASGSSSSDWVKKAFSEAHNFLTGNVEAEDKLGIANPILELFKKIVKAINFILLIAILSGASPRAETNSY